MNDGCQCWKYMIGVTIAFGAVMYTIVVCKYPNSYSPSLPAGRVPKPRHLGPLRGQQHHDLVLPLPDGGLSH